VTRPSWMFVALAVLGFAAVASAQQPSASSTAPAAAPRVTPAPLIPLKVQVVISKFQGEKKVSSSPYTLAVNANDPPKPGKYVSDPAELTSAIQVLIPMVTVNEKTTGPVYKDVGTTIRCTAATLDGGRFRLDLSVEDSSVYPESKIPADGARGPWLQAFRSNQTLILKDGQTTEYTTATEQVSGEVVKVDVTLTLVK
jgi:hypothetical protein